MKNINPGSIIFFIIFAFIALNILEGLGGIIPILVIFFVMRSIFSRGEGNQRRNRGGSRQRGRRRYDRRDQSRDFERQPQQQAPRRKAPPKPVSRRPKVKKNPFKKSGIEKFKDYDYEGAIADFQKALQVDSRDKAIHFNLACAYSLNEEKEKSFHHLAKAVEYGLVDFEKIKTHDALAYIRIQDEFDAFVKSGYNWPLQQSATTQGTDDLITNKPDLLEQLKQLGALRDKGLLTQEEFLAQKEKLMR